MQEMLEARPLGVGMRRLLFIASGLVGLAASQLFVLTDHTDLYFSWTIKPGATAAFLGAGYLASVFLESLAARRANWIDARHSIPPVLSFTVLTEVATLAHLSKFHFHEQLVWAGLAAWVWIAIYTAVPIAIVILLPAQLRGTEVPVPRTTPIPAAAIVVLGVQTAVLLPVGALLFLAPARWPSLWPWELTPLTSQAVGAWLLGIVFGIAAVIADRDLVRIRPGLIAYTVFGTAQFLTLARYGRDVQWGEPSAWIFVAVIGSMAAIGWLGVWVAHGLRSR